MAVVAIEVDEPLDLGAVSRHAAPCDGEELRKVGRREFEWLATIDGGVAQLTDRVEQAIGALEASCRARAGVALHPLHADQIDSVRQRAWDACSRGRSLGRTITVWQPSFAPRSTGRSNAGDGTSPDSSGTVRHEVLAQPVVAPQDRSLIAGRVHTGHPQEPYHPTTSRTRGPWRDRLEQALRAWLHETTVPLWWRVTSEMLDRDAVEAISDLLVAVGASPTTLVLELSDRSPTPWDEVRDVLVDLREGGVKVLLTDVGAGHTPWVRLRQVPVDGLVVDGSLLRRDGRAAADRAYLVAVAEAGGSHPLGVGAAGVASAEAVRLLGQLGYTFVHGPWIGRLAPVGGVAR